MPRGSIAETPVTLDEESIETGESYVATPGHRPLLFAGTELVEFTKASEFEQTVAVVMNNLEATKAGA